MMKWTRLSVIAAAAVVTAASVNAQNRYTWRPGDSDIRGGVYSVNWNGSIGNAVVSAGAFTTGDQLNASVRQRLGSSNTAVVFNPDARAYNIVANNAYITDVWIVSVQANGGIDYTGSAWLNSGQNPRGGSMHGGPQGRTSLMVYNNIGFNGVGSSLYATDTIAAGSVLGVNNQAASLGIFSTSLENVALAPVIRAIDPNRAFGVSIYTVSVPEPSSIAAVVTGGLGLLAIRRRRR